MDECNDTVIGDPLYTVPINVPDPNVTALLGPCQPKLCFEVHGHPDKYYNLVSDECTSVSAHYIPVGEFLDEVSIRTVDNNGFCKNILVRLDGCSASVDGMTVERSYSENGISISRRASIGRIRVNVPNCNDLTLIMRIDCQEREMQGSNGTVKMLRFEVLRGLNFGHRDSHGLLGGCVVRYSYILRHCELCLW